MLLRVLLEAFAFATVLGGLVAVVVRALLPPNLDALALLNLYWGAAMLGIIGGEVYALVRADAWFNAKDAEFEKRFRDSLPKSSEIHDRAFYLAAMKERLAGRLAKED